MSHDRIASIFDAWVRDGTADGLQQSHGDVARQVLATMDLRPGTMTLDLGCGTGWATRLLAAAAPGAQAVGIDVSAAMIARAEEQHDLTSRARYQRSTFEAMDLPDDHFDRVFSMEALYYAVDLPAALGEMCRVLKPGGVADVVIDRYEESPHTASWDASVGLEMIFLGEAGWAQSFEEAGFTGVVTRRVIDSRGPGDEADFVPCEHCPDHRTRLELHEAGSLWIHAEKPARPTT